MESDIKFTVGEITLCKNNDVYKLICHGTDVEFIYEVRATDLLFICTAFNALDIAPDHWTPHKVKTIYEFEINDATIELSKAGDYYSIFIYTDSHEYGSCISGDDVIIFRNCIDTIISM